MAFLHDPFGTLVQAQFIGERDGQEITNILHWSTLDDFAPGPGPTIDMQGKMEDFRDQFITHLIPEILPDYVLKTVRVDLIDSFTWGATPRDWTMLSVYSREFNPEQAGTKVVASDPVNTFTAVGVQKRCDVQNKYTRGSMRLDALVENEIQENLIDVGVLANLQTALDAFAAPISQLAEDMTIVLWHPVVFSRTKGFTPGGTLNNPGQQNCVRINQFVAKRLVTSQVSRKRTK